MMNTNFIKSLIKVAIYARKADTKNSYYRQSGDDVLPSRIDLSLGNTFTQAAHKGRMLMGNVVGEIRGQFKKTEESPLKQFKPYKISSKIFRQLEFPQLIGWSDIAVSDPEGKAKKIEGIAVFADMGNDSLQIFFMAGNPLPDLISSVCEYVSSEIEKGRPDNLPILDSKNEH